MHIEKFTANQLGQILTHIDRPRDRNYSNENIDKSKSRENYSFHFKNRDDEKTLDYINKRVNEVKHMNRSDVVKLVGVVITLPKDYRGDEKEFFKAVCSSFIQRYGFENIAYATVHKDEKTPHMHLGIIPVVKTVDKKTGKEIEKLCAKELFDKVELKKLHPEIEKSVSVKLKQQVHLMNDRTELNPETGKPYRDFKELKRKSSKEKEDLPRDFLGKIDYEKSYLLEREKRIEQSEKLEEQRKENTRLKNEVYEQAQALNRLQFDNSILKNDRDSLKKSLALERDKYDTLVSDKKLLAEKYHQLDKKRDRNRDERDF